MILVIPHRFMALFPEPNSTLAFVSPHISLTFEYSVSICEKGEKGCHECEHQTQNHHQLSTIHVCPSRKQMESL